MSFLRVQKVLQKGYVKEGKTKTIKLTGCTCFVADSSGPGRVPGGGGGGVRQGGIPRKKKRAKKDIVTLWCAKTCLLAKDAKPLGLNGIVGGKTGSL